MSVPAEAQLGQKSWEFFPHIGAFLPSDPDFLKGQAGFESFDPGTLWGIYMTYHYTDYVGVELGFSKTTANHDSHVLPGDIGVGDVGMDFWEVNGFLNSGALKTLQLFATAGGGLVNFDPEHGDGVTRLLLDGGVGARWYAWKNIALRAEVKDFFFPKAKRGDYTGRADVVVPVDLSGAGSESVSGPGPDDNLHNVGFFAGLTFNF
jgi:hypothetical protein